MPVLLVLASGTSVVAQPDTYVLNTSTSAPWSNSEQTGFQNLVVAEVFRRIGLKARVKQYDASKRALVNANANVDHGVAMRIKGLERKYPNLVRVEERLVQNDFVAYSRNLNLVTSDWKSLVPHSLAYINGWVIFERNLVADQKKHAVHKPEQMFEMLKRKRIDLVLYERWQGLLRAREGKLKVKVHEPPLASVDMFMYVHKSHAHLAPRLAEALRSMKADGTWNKYFDQALSVLATSAD